MSSFFCILAYCIGWSTSQRNLVERSGSLLEISPVQEHESRLRILGLSFTSVPFRTYEGFQLILGKNFPQGCTMPGANANKGYDNGNGKN